MICNDYSQSLGEKTLPPLQCVRFFDTEMPQENTIRLQKILADRGIASRREAERLITSGVVKVNGKKVTELGTRADPNKDIIEVEEEILDQREEQKIIVALNKPVGYVTSTKKTVTDPHIVLDLVPSSFPPLFPAGRLDKETSGLLILTNDGITANKLTHPRHGHEKTYEALLTKPVPEEDLDQIRHGELWILGKKIRPAPVERLGGSRVEIVLREGKNRQIRRLFRMLGSGVKKLRRVAIGNLRLEDLHLREGEMRALSEREVEKMFEFSSQSVPE